MRYEDYPGIMILVGHEGHGVYMLREDEVPFFVGGVKSQERGLSLEVRGNGENYLIHGARYEIPTKYGIISVNPIFDRIMRTKDGSGLVNQIQFFINTNNTKYEVLRDQLIIENRNYGLIDSLKKLIEKNKALSKELSEQLSLGANCRRKKRINGKKINWNSHDVENMSMVTHNGIDFNKVRRKY